MNRTARYARESGISLLEVITITAVIGLLSVLLVQALRGLSTSQKYTEDQARTLAIGERVLQRVVRDLEFAIRVFPEASDSRVLLSRMDAAGVVPRESSLLPKASDLGYFAPDPAGRDETGNVLFLAASRAPESVSVLVAQGVVDARIDMFHFVLYCLADIAPQQLDLQRWGSRPVARFRDIDSHPSSIKTAIVLELRSRGIEYAWAVDESVTSFYRLASDGQVMPVGTNFKLAADMDQIRRDILTPNRLMVASNGGAGTIPVPLYSSSTKDFPHGFEVKIDGRSGGQLVMLRLVISTVPHAKRRSNHAEVVRLVSIKES